MKKVQMSTTIDATPDVVWQMIGGFNTLQDWHPAVQRSDLANGGVMRKLSLFGGGAIVERLEHFDNHDRAYTYSIVDAPLPVRNYVSTLRVKDGGDGKSAIVEWSSEFEAAAGVSDNDAMAAVQGIYQSGLDNLKKLFGMP